MSRGPLSGIRVLDAGMNVAGPMAASILGDFGAEVVKIEPPVGDSTRALRPSVGDASAIFAMANRNKRLVSLDLRTVEGREVLAELLASADVLVENLRPGKSTGLGLDPATCHDVNPGLVHASISAFHTIDATRPGYDLLVQAESGIMDLTGPADGDPVRLPGTMVDQVAGSWAAMGVLAELLGSRLRPVVEVRMIDVALWLLAEKVSGYLATGEPPSRQGSGTSVTTPHGAYRAADADVVIGAASDTMFQRLGDVLGGGVADDHRFATQAGRLAHREALDRAIQTRLAEGTAATWVSRLADAGVPVAQIRSLPESIAWHREHSATGLRESGIDDFALLAPPLTTSGGRWELVSACGPVGRDNTEVLTELGVAGDRLARLSASGVLGGG